MTNDSNADPFKNIDSHHIYILHFTIIQRLFIIRIQNERFRMKKNIPYDISTMPVNRIHAGLIEMILQYDRIDSQP